MVIIFFNRRGIPVNVRSNFKIQFFLHQYIQMMIQILLIICAVSRANALHLSEIIDESKDGSIDGCVNSKSQCNPHLENPCCQRNNTCKLHERMNDKKIYACLELIYLGEYCVNVIDCLSIDHAICNSNNECECGPDFAAVNKTKCAPLITSPCWGNDDCVVKNSVCINNECTCKPTFVSYFKDHCKPTTLGQHCSNDYDCGDIMHIMCSNKKACMCKPNHVIQNNATCAPLFGGFCENDNACANDNLICINSRCQCKNGNSPTSNNGCISKLLGTTCNNDYECKNLMHMKCSETKTCTCRPHHIIKNDVTCASLLGGYCQHDEQCGVENSICSDNKCQCKNKYILNSPETCSPTPLGERCNSDFDCSKILYSECSNDNKCVCQENYIAKSNNTLCLPLLGAFCMHGDQCSVNNSYCVDNVCQCKVHFRSIRNNKCVPTKLGTFCLDILDCEDILHLHCSDSFKCECKTNHVSKDNSTCLPLLDEYCWVYDKCAPENSICLLNNCRCKPNYLQRSNNQCIQMQKCNYAHHYYTDEKLIIYAFPKIQFFYKGQFKKFLTNANHISV